MKIVEFWTITFELDYLKDILPPSTWINELPWNKETEFFQQIQSFQEGKDLNDWSILCLLTNVSPPTTTIKSLASIGDGNRLVDACIINNHTRIWK